MIRTTDTNSKYNDRDLPNGERRFTVVQIVDGPKGSNKWMLKYDGGEGAQLLWPEGEGPLLKVLECRESRPGVFEWDSDLMSGKSFIATVSEVPDKKDATVMRKKMAGFKKAEKSRRYSVLAMADIPAQKTKMYLESLGWHVDFCNRWLMGANIRKDFLGLGDLGAIRHDFKGTWFINACLLGDVQKHIKAYLDGGIRTSGKMKGQTFPPNPHLPVLLCGNRFSIFGWDCRRERDEDGDFKKNKNGTRTKAKRWIFKVWEGKLNGAQPTFVEIPNEQ